MPSSGARVRIILAVAALVALVLAYRAWWRSGDDALVVYCAHDAEFADALFAEFRKRTGIAVAVRYDSEATKSLGLVERLIQEGEQPRCDVFWNNEQLGTADLDARGLLAAYRGPGWQRMPAGAKQADGHWTGFAARMRVMIINTARMPATREAVRARLAGDLARVAIAKPLFGTTLTHYSTAWALLGGERVQAWHRACRARGIREVDGNGMVRELVAGGACDLGFTDTDDYFAAVDQGRPVAMLPARIADLAAAPADGAAAAPERADPDATILIPNTVAILRGAAHREAAERLVDFLLSADGELMLARSGSRQIPLGAVEDAALPSEVRELRAQAGQAAAPSGLAAARSACLAWLKAEYAP